MLRNVGGVGAPVLAFLSRQRDDLIRDAIVGLVVTCIAFLAAVWWDDRTVDRQRVIEEERAAHEEMLENTRFVRQVALERNTVKPFAGLNLNGAVLSGLNLASLSEETVSVDTVGESTTAETAETAAKFQNADLRGADLSGSNLSGADFSGAEAHRTDFSFTVLRSMRIFYRSKGIAATDFSKADLSGAKLDGAWLTNVDLRGANLSGAQLVHTRLNSVQLDGANLSYARMEGPQIASELEGVKLCFNDETQWPQSYVHGTPAECTEAQLTEATRIRIGGF